MKSLYRAKHEKLEKSDEPEVHAPPKRERSLHLSHAPGSEAGRAGKLAGLIGVADPIKETTAPALSQAHVDIARPETKNRIRRSAFLQRIPQHVEVPPNLEAKRIIPCFSAGLFCLSNTLLLIN